MTNLFKKSFIGVSILFLFVLGLTLIHTEKVDAAIFVDTWADDMNIPYGGSTYIRWTASGGVTSCTRNDTGTTVSFGNGTFNFYTGALYATKTFSITCTGTGDGVPTAGSCSGTYVSTPALCLKSGSYYPQNYTCGTNCCYRSTVASTVSSCFATNLTPIVAAGCSSCVCAGTTISAVTSSCSGLNYTTCTTVPRSSGSPHCTWVNS